MPRILETLRRYGIQSTFFIPGHTIESVPDEVAAILQDGHEVAHHSYAHVDPSEQTPDEERRDMERAFADPDYLANVRPDEPRFIDIAGCMSFVTEENRVI